MQVDTQITYLDRDKGLITGYLYPYGSPDERVTPGAVYLQDGKHADLETRQAQSFYVTADSRIAIRPNRGVPLNVDHHYEAGSVGYITWLQLDDNGLLCHAQLTERAAHMMLGDEGKPGRWLPELLTAGRLYFCPETFTRQRAPDGRLIEADLCAVALTAHPAYPKKAVSR